MPRVFASAMDAYLLADARGMGSEPHTMLILLTLRRIDRIGRSDTGAGHRESRAGHGPQRSVSHERSTPMQPSLDGAIIDMDAAAPCFYCGASTHTHVYHLAPDGDGGELRPVCQQHLAGELASGKQEGRA